MDKKQVVKHIQPIDLAILRDLYRYRILTTQQVKQKFFSSSRQYVYKKMYVLKNSGWIKAFPVMRENGRKLTSGYRLTDAGISCLKQEGDLITRGADDLKVSKATLTYLLATNDVMVHLHPEWGFRDSREVKKRYNLNRGDMIQGALVGEDGIDHALYVLLPHIQEMSINRLVGEMEISNLAHHLVLAKGETSFDRFIRHAMQRGVMAGGSLSVMPYGFGLQYLKAYSPPEFLHEPLKHYGTVSPVHHALFDWIVKPNSGKESYLVNLLDTDLMKIHSIYRYTQDEYRRDGRRVLVLTHMREKHEQLLSELHHVDYWEVDLQEIFS